MGPVNGLKFSMSGLVIHNWEGGVGRRDCRLAGDQVKTKRVMMCLPLNCRLVCVHMFEIDHQWLHQMCMLNC